MDLLLIAHFHPRLETKAHFGELGLTHHLSLARVGSPCTRTPGESFCTPRKLLCWVFSSGMPVTSPGGFLGRRLKTSQLLFHHWNRFFFMRSNSWVFIMKDGDWSQGVGENFKKIILFTSYVVSTQEEIMERSFQEYFILKYHEFLYFLLTPTQH